MGILNDLRVSRKPLAGFLVIGGAWAAFFAQMPVIKAAIGASDGVYGTLVLFSSMGALAAMWLAPLADRLMGRWALPGSSLLVAGGMAAAGAAAGPMAFVLGLLLAAVGSGVVDVLVNVRVSEKEEQLGRPLMNLNHAMYSFTYAGAALLTGVLRELAWTPLQIFTAFFCIVVVLAAVMLERRAVGLADKSDAVPDTVLPARLVWLGGGMVMVAFLVEASSEGWSTLHLERTLGGGPAEGAMGPAILGLTMGIGRLAGHLLSDRLPELKLMVVACLAAAAGLVIAGAAPGLFVAYFGFGLTGLGVSVIAPLTLALVGRVVPPKARLAAISRVSVLGYGAFFMGPPLMGLTSELLGLRAGFILVGGIMVLAALALVPALGRTVMSRQEAGRV
ncbi:MFS transporter [uncultured Roseobacter sp.]|uniref:MFS transporter n=1 Tax=uncultured Roseobacter sp. TaxID=114847 RepID=UPI002635D8E8|nr:MFS transporter [uncultured Roseobacter sp.]